MLSGKKRAIVILIVCLLVGVSFSADGGDGKPNAAELVRDVRKTEMWLHEVGSFHFKAEGKWTNTEKGIAERRRRIIEESGEENPDVRRYPSLIKEKQDSLEIAVDRKRVRYLTDDPSYWRQFKIWDGDELKIHEKYYHHAQEHYHLDNKIEERMFNEMFGSNFGWPRSQPHSFWWDEKDVDEIMKAYGRAEEFELLGKETYREIRCYVLEYEYPSGSPGNLVFRWYVGQSKHLLYGIKIVRHGKVGTEHWMLEYREVVPGGWFPKRTGWAFYGTAESGEPYLRSTRDLKVAEFHVNEPLSDELFEMEIQPDVRIQDLRSGKLRVYRKTQWKTLSGKPLPSFEGMNIEKPPGSENLLVCFADLEQRPSRRMLRELFEQWGTFGQKAPNVLLLQTSEMSAAELSDWRERLNVPFEISVMTGDVDSVLSGWGTRSLPWFILTDGKGIVVCEGVGVPELVEKMKSPGRD